MAKSVSINGRVFPTITEAKEHFALLLESHDLEKEFTGEAFADINAVYEEYCIKTDWKLQSPPVSFYPIYERGPGYTTRCYGVTFQNGTSDRFSMEKALRKIAK